MQSGSYADLTFAPHRNGNGLDAVGLVMNRSTFVVFLLVSVVLSACADVAGQTSPTVNPTEASTAAPGDGMVIGELIAEIGGAHELASVVVADTEARREELIEALGNVTIPAGAAAAEVLAQQLDAIRQPQLSQFSIVALTQDVCRVRSTAITSRIPGELDFLIIHDGTVDCATNVPVTWVYLVAPEFLDTPGTTIDGTALTEALSVRLPG